MKAWKLSEIDFVKRNASAMTVKEMAKALNRSRESVKGLMTRQRILTGRDGCFKPGFKPHNAGSIGRMKPNRTSFKPGDTPHNTKHDGAISVRKDSSRTAYKFIRMSKGKWKLLHRHVWEQANGPIPPKHIVVFRDRDPMNCELDNLELITMAENARRNHNRQKASESMRKLWKRVRTLNEVGVTPTNIKLKLKRKTTDTSNVKAIVDADQLKEVGQNYFNA